MGRSNVYLFSCYCGLLFSAGIVFGFIFTTTGQVGFVSFLNALASLATVGAALTAIYALNSWYPQFKHAEKYKVIKEFRDTVSDVDFIRRFVLSLRSNLMVSLNGSESSDNSEDLPYNSFGMEMWWAHIAKLSYAWKNMTELLSDEELASFSLTPSDLDNSITELFSTLTDIVFEDDRTTFRRQMSLVKSAADGGRKITSEYQQLENGTRYLLKKLSS